MDEIEGFEKSKNNPQTAGSILLWENHKNEGLLETRANPLPVRGHLLLLTTQTHQGKEMERKTESYRVREGRKKRLADSETVRMSDEGRNLLKSQQNCKL